MTYYILMGTDPNDRMSWNPTVWDTEPVGFEWMTEEQYSTKFPPPAPPESTPEELATQEQQQALAAANQIIQSAIQQQAVQTMSFAPTAFSLLAKAGLFEEWTPEREYEPGQRFVFEGVVYETAGVEPVEPKTESPDETQGMKINGISMLGSLPVIPGQPGSEAHYKPLSVKE